MKCTSFTQDFDLTGFNVSNYYRSVKYGITSYSRISSSLYSNFAEKNSPCCHTKRVIDVHKKLELEHSNFDLGNGLIAKLSGVTDKRLNDVSEANKSVEPKPVDIAEEEKHDVGYRDLQKDIARFSYRSGKLNKKPSLYYDYSKEPRSQALSTPT